MSPYDADPAKRPESDRYADVPLYGRYLPRECDFRPDDRYIKNYSDEALVYWETVLLKCTPDVRIYENQDGGRDVFALGSVIVKSSHLKESLNGRKAHRDYSLADANEVKATELALRSFLRERSTTCYLRLYAYTRSHTVLDP